MSEPKGTHVRRSLDPEPRYIPWPLETTVTPRAMHYIAMAIAFFLSETTEVDALPDGVETEMYNTMNMMRNWLQQKAERSRAAAQPAPLGNNEDLL